MDILWWMDAIGQLDERYDEVEEIVRARRLPSLQVIGTPERRTLDLNALAENCVELVGRLAGISGGTAQFSGSLANVCAGSDLKQGRLLDRSDGWATEHGLDDEVTAPERPNPSNVSATPKTGLALSEVSTVIWATGFKPNYPWLDDALLDAKGAIRHNGGVMAQPGMYVLGLPFTRRRKSRFIDGVGPDALELSDYLAGHLDRLAART